jgi:hypothetical protein
MNILITGHTSGIGKILYDKFGGTGLSRSTGFDITKDSIIPYIEPDTIFINNAYNSKDPFAQTRLLYETYSLAKHVICIGSNSPYEGIYKTSKNSLEIACNDLFYKGYNVTNIKLGKVDTPFQDNYSGDKISKETIIKTFEFIFSIRERINEISIRPRSE